MEMVSLVGWIRTRWEENSGSDACKGGRQELMHSEKIIYHCDGDGDSD